MIVLGIETSSPVCSIGLVDDRGRTWETAVEDRHVHSDSIVGLIGQTIAKADLALEALQGVAISAGPGSFTGLRIGMSAAKGLCKALNIPIVAVSTFEAVAGGVLAAHPESDRVMVAVDAKRDDFYIMMFERKNEKCRPLGEAAVIGRSALRAVLGDVRLICTDRAAEMGEYLGGGTTVVEMRQVLSGARIALRGQERALKGLWDDVVSLEPLYLKDFIVRQPPAGSSGASTED